MKCQVCEREFETNYGLGRHISVHQIKARDYYLLYVKPDAVVICRCGRPKKFHGINVGFLQFCSPRCAFSSDEVREKKRLKQAQTNQKISNSMKGVQIPPQTRRAVAEARKRYRGHLSYNWNPDRLEQARKARVSRLCYGLVGRALAYLGKEKTGHGQELLGYTSQELRAHIEKQFQEGMSWENHGEWHVDHIRPVSDFGPGAEVSEINSLSNLRPLWMKENLSLGGRQACKIRYRR